MMDPFSVAVAGAYVQTLVRRLKWASLVLLIVAIAISVLGTVGSHG